MDSRYQLYKHILMGCAAAVEAENLNVADSLLRDIKSLISAETDEGVRKLVNCYAAALVRRVYGIHPHHLPFLPSERLYDLYAYLFYPFAFFADLTTKTAIEDAFVPGNNRVHVIDFSITRPWTWVWLMEELASRKRGGVASFRLTWIVPKLSLPFGDFLQQTRKGLTAVAEHLQIDFELTVLVVNYARADDIVKCCMSKLRRTCQDEMLVVRWSFSLHKLLSKEGAIDSVLFKMKGLKPDIMVIVEQEANHNGPDFLNRFAQSFQYYSSVFESLDKDVFVFGDPRKELWETYFRRQIENVVSCEDFDRIERHESVALWQQRLFQAGFIPVFLQSDIFRKQWTGYEIQKKDGHALLCRDNGPLALTSVWKHQELTHFNPGLDIVAQDVSELPLNEVFEMASSSDSDDDHVDDPTTKTGRNIWSIRGFSMIRIAASAKLFDMSEYMCPKYELPIALAWISSGRGDNLNSRGKWILRTVETACYVKDLWNIEFVRAYVNGHLEEGQGVAGKALQSDGCFVPDISVFDAIDYPFADNAKNLDLLAAVAIKLSSTDTCNDDYILEFFLPKNMKGSSEQKTLIDTLRCLAEKMWELVVSSV